MWQYFAGWLLIYVIHSSTTSGPYLICNSKSDSSWIWKIKSGATLLHRQSYLNLNLLANSSRPGFYASATLGFTALIINNSKHPYAAHFSELQERATLLTTTLRREVMQSPPSVCPSLSSTFGTKWPLTSNFCMCVGQDHRLQGIEGQGQGHSNAVSPTSIQRRLFPVLFLYFSCMLLSSLNKDGDNYRTKKCNGISVCDVSLRTSPSECLWGSLRKTSWPWHRGLGALALAIKTLITTLQYTHPATATPGRQPCPSHLRLPFTPSGLTARLLVQHHFFCTSIFDFYFFSFFYF